MPRKCLNNIASTTVKRNTLQRKFSKLRKKHAVIGTLLEDVSKAKMRFPLGLSNFRRFTICS
jgi:hypothetical protein